MKKLAPTIYKGQNIQLRLPFTGEFTRFRTCKGEGANRQKKAHPVAERLTESGHSGSLTQQ